MIRQCQRVFTSRRAKLSTWLSMHHEGGASSVEFAILAPLVFMITFGMISGGLAFNSKQSMNAAAREGARYAATLPKPNPETNAGWATWLQQVTDVTINEARGDLTIAENRPYVCVAFVRTTDPAQASQNQRQVTNPNNNPWTDAQNTTLTNGRRCIESDGRPNGEARVQVVVSRGFTYQAILVAPSVWIQSSSVSRHEPIVANPAPPPSPSPSSS